MVLLPKLKSGQKKKRTQKNFQKLLKTGKNKEKNISVPTNQTIFFGELYVKPCAESNGTTPGLENWCNKKICPKD